MGWLFARRCWCRRRSSIRSLRAGADMTARFRIGIDTGGTFTDVVAVDAATGAIVTTKTPSTPHDPSLAVLEGLRKVCRLAGAAASEVAAVCHGTTVATNALAGGAVRGPRAADDRGVSPHPGDRAPERAPGLRQLVLLGEARADRAGPPGPRGAGAAEPTAARSCASSTRRRPARSRDGAGNRGIDVDRRELPPRLRQSGPRAADAGGRSRRSTPGPTSRSRPRCWPEYREYERTVTTLVDAFVEGARRRLRGARSGRAWTRSSARPRPSTS